METKDRPKLVRKSRAKKRMELLEEKDCRRSSDDVNERGFSTDQTIAMQNLDMQMKRSIVEQQKVKTEQHEILLIGLTSEDNMLLQQILLAEKMAEKRCPEYDETNKHWEKVDMLIKRQEKLFEKISNMNKKFHDDIMNQKKEIAIEVNDESVNNDKDSILSDEDLQRIMSGNIKKQLLDEFGGSDGLNDQQQVIDTPIDTPALTKGRRSPRKKNYLFHMKHMYILK